MSCGLSEIIGSVTVPFTLLALDIFQEWRDTCPSRKWDLLEGCVMFRSTRIGPDLDPGLRW